MAANWLTNRASSVLSVVALRGPVEHEEVEPLALDGREHLEGDDEHHVAVARQRPERGSLGARRRRARSPRARPGSGGGPSPPARGAAPAAAAAATQVLGVRRGRRAGAVRRGRRSRPRGRSPATTRAYSALSVRTSSSMPAWPTTKMKPTGTTIGTRTSRAKETHSVPPRPSIHHAASSTTDEPGEHPGRDLGERPAAERDGERGARQRTGARRADVGHRQELGAVGREEDRAGGDRDPREGQPEREALARQQQDPPVG